MIFIGYNPYAPPRTTPPHAADLPDVPLHVFTAAEDVHATHLSADGLRAYVEYDSEVRVCFWDDEGRAFGSSFPCGGLPADAVRMP